MSGPVLRYPGAKWRLASWIAAQFPAHKVYVEPFFGSGATFFTKSPSHSELINDLDGDVVNLFRVLRAKPSAEAKASALESTPWAREEWADAKESRTQPAEDPIERARRFLVLAWQSHGQRLGYGCGWRHDGPQGSHQSVAQQWRNLPGRVLASVERLKDAMIECRPALDIIHRYRGEEVLLYCDPPYLGSTRRHKRLYNHELSRADEHEELLAALLAHPGPVVLSGYASELYDERLRGWAKATAPSVTEKGKPRTEVLWMNRPLLQGQLWRAQ